MNPSLSSYLARIGFIGSPQPDLATLRRIQRGHLERIPYENLDVQLGRPVSLDGQEALAKLVKGARGGWCYEMNAVLLWALETIGFRVMPMTGAVMRAERGPSAIGNHLVLSVALDQPYIVDAGLGDGPVEPIPLKEGSYPQQGRLMRLEALDQGWWRLHNDADSFATAFDFRHQPVDWELLAGRCSWLQTSPESRFVQNAICVRHLPGGILSLVGRVLKLSGEAGIKTRLVGSAAEYVETLATSFGIELPEAAGLWPQICRRHEALFGG